ncbi:54S ribosomal protein L51, mitochondrial [Ceratocystis lukuohia]|uniref:Large ribosomal subunit protein mL43 n=2 Tax=Ceratocystis TaxID=5157 RepID=A0A2C5X783_9PEZI|nr:54S ribosomal protein L51, mitochondrial [Ceratocystis fimbriata CBS 114723]
MTIRALTAVSTGQNGVGAFVLQCKKLSFHYCDWAGSSVGMKTLRLPTPQRRLAPYPALQANTLITIYFSGFIKSQLTKFAASNPEIEIEVSPRPGKHPVIIGQYITGKERAICVRNLQPDQVLKKAMVLRNATGEKNKRTNKPVTSITESVRGVWSPYHGTGTPV